MVFALKVPPKPGTSLCLQVNHGKRLAMVLGVRGQQLLVEYRMPGGTTALRQGNFCLSSDDISWSSGLSYLQISPSWLQAIIEAGQAWIGKPQQHGAISRYVPPVETLLLQKRFVLAYRRFWHSSIANSFLSQIRRQRGCSSVSGWEQGGCGVAAQGLLGWIRSSLASSSYEEYAQVRLYAVSGKGHPAAHIFVSIRLKEQEVCLDTTGTKSRAALLHRWLEFYRLADAHAVPIEDEEQAFRRVRVPYNSEIGTSLSAALKEAFGDFPLFLLFPKSD